MQCLPFFPIYGIIILNNSDILRQVLCVYGAGLGRQGAAAADKRSILWASLILLRPVSVA